MSSPPKIESLPDILTPSEIEQLIGKTRKLRYRVFLLTTYSMGLRLSETLSLQVGDIDRNRKQVHIQAILGHAHPNTPARYAQLTHFTEKDSLSTINSLVNTIHVDFKKV